MSYSLFFKRILFLIFYNQNCKENCVPFWNPPIRPFPMGYDSIDCKKWQINTTFQEKTSFKRERSSLLFNVKRLYFFLNYTYFSGGFIFKKKKKEEKKKNT